MHRFAASFATGLLLGCAAPPEAPPPPRGTVVTEALARLSPRGHALTIAPAPGAPGLSPQSVDTVPLVQDGTPGSGPASTVELVTNSVSDTFAGGTCPGVAPGVKAFCGNITLNSFFPRPLGHVFVQVTGISDVNFQPLAGHGGINPDPAALGLDPSLGLWAYTAPGAAAPGVLGVAPDNGGARDWVFANPDDADTYASLRVVASLSYASYTRAAASLPFVDACAGGTQLGTTLTSVADLPFPFTLYDTTTSKVTINRRGVLLAGVNGLIAPSKNVALPAAGNVPACTLFSQCTVPRPAIFPFWDALLFLGEGNLCTLAGGAAPSRTFAVTWSHLGRSGSLADVGSDYSFTVVLHEGTDVIDLLYGQMLGPLPNAAGAAAVVGVQNAAGTVATAEFHKANYGTGASYTLTPVP
jgi:hypothetical protein